ncbi:hypothetical protein [Streptomyces sp. NPDC016626]|uniref:hypothetical protein n=1 Tax=Streptomyces sp. NPDC016626 TaxID=3364968 RepID=UPI00370297AA
MSSSISSIRMPVCRSTSTVAQDQNAASSSWGQVPPPAGGHLGDVDAAGLPGPAALELLPGNEEPSTGRRRASHGYASLGVLALPLDGAKQGGQ